MLKTATASLMLAVIALGFGVPAVCIYYSVFHNFNSILAGLTAVIALIVAGAIGVVGAITLGSTFLEGGGSAERERLNVMRAHQRATLEELDDIISILKEIRDLLKAAQE